MVLSADRRVAIVTGAGGGIGSAVARRFATDGYDLVLAFHSDRSTAEEVAADCETAGARTVLRATELSAPESIGELFQTAAADLGRVDVYVHNAAVAVLARIRTLAGPRYADYLRSFDVNTHSLLFALNECGERMTAGGRVVAISSLNAVLGLSGSTAYAASKAATEAMIRSAARELGPKGITCNTLQLGLVDTPTARSVTTDEVANLYAMQAPAGRLGTSDEVAAEVAHLASPDSGWLTGQTIRLDGGFQFR